MELRNIQFAVGALFLIIVTGAMSAQQEEPLCVENSPERRGEVGCSIVENKALSMKLNEPVFWHIDRFDSEAPARAAAGPASVAFGAHGAWWVMSIESQAEDHHAGEHVARVKLSPLPEAAKYSMYSAFLGSISDRLLRLSPTFPKFHHTG